MVRSCLLLRWACGRRGKGNEPAIAARSFRSACLSIDDHVLSAWHEVGSAGTDGNPRIRSTNLLWVVGVSPNPIDANSQEMLKIAADESHLTESHHVNTVQLDALEAWNISAALRAVVRIENQRLLHVANADIRIGHVANHAAASRVRLDANSIVSSVNR